ncbi:MAG: carboxylating nicotinate-nucleotide diphosphorylase [Verrucomicrobiota bacterium]
MKAVILNSSLPVLDSPILREAACRALGEDRGPVDVTSWISIPEEAKAKARVISRERAVVSGLPVAERVFLETDSGLRMTTFVQDSQVIEKGVTILEVEGSLRSILTGERTALNYLQHLSGIATQTQRYVEEVKGTRTRILDTRKTTPGLRLLEKYAVACGGGMNHRIGLYDMFLFKDNHLAFFKNPEEMKEVIEKARQWDPPLKIEVEADTVDQVRWIVELNVDRILLDNMSLDQMRESVAIIAGRCETEASGGMTLERLRSVADCGVDYISVGALTHSVKAIDFSLEVVT